MTQAPSIYDIHKSAAIIINNRKLLVERSQGKAVFVAPGGKLEADETPRQCETVFGTRAERRVPARHCRKRPEKFGTFYAEAAGSHNAGKSPRMPKTYELGGLR